MIYDQKRTEELERLGIKVLRFWNDDVLYGIGEVAKIINKEINKIPLAPFDKGGETFDNCLGCIKFCCGHGRQRASAALCAR